MTNMGILFCTSLLESQGLFVIGECHSEPKAKNLKSLGKNLVLVLNRGNAGKDFRPFAIAQGDNEKTLPAPVQYLDIPAAR